MKCPRGEHDCPRPDDCLGFTDPRVCTHVGGLVVNRLRNPVNVVGDDRASGPKLRRSPRLGGRVRAGLLAPGLRRGGAESVQLAQIRATAGRIDWQGCVVLADERSAHPGMLAEHRALLPVAFGIEEAVRLAAQVDVLISWAATPHRPILDRVQNPPKVIFLDHFPHFEVYPQAFRDCLDGVDWLVHVSPLCVPGCPPDWADRSSVIWNAVDPVRILPGRDKAVVRAGWGIPVDAPVAGFFSRLDHRRHPDAMIRMAPCLPPDWHVVIMGDGGPYPGEVAKLARMVGDLAPDVAARVHVLPPEATPGEVMPAFDVLVVLSGDLHESFGLTMAEGHALRRAVVGNASGLELIQPGFLYLVPVDPSGEVLASAVLKAYQEGPRPGADEFVRREAGIGRFGRRWARLIERVADPIDPEEVVRNRAEFCTDGEGPCGCGNGPPRICRKGGGRREVRRSDCLSCKREELAHAG